MEKAAAAFAQTLTVDADYPNARHRLAGAQALGAVGIARQLRLEDVGGGLQAAERRLRAR